MMKVNKHIYDIDKLIQDKDLVEKLFIDLFDLTKSKISIMRMVGVGIRYLYQTIIF